MTLRTAMHWRSAVAAATAAVTVAGCGSAADYANRPRPPEPIIVSAAVFPGRIVVSPQRFGAGQINLLVTNQTQQSVELVLETNEAPGSNRSGLQQKLGPINPQGTASLKATLTPGSWQLRDTNGFTIAHFSVGRPRPSSQNQLLQP